MSPTEILAIWRRVTKKPEGKTRSMILQAFADLIVDRAMIRASRQLAKGTDSETVHEVMRITGFVQRSKDEEDLIQYLDRAFRALVPKKFTGKLSDDDFGRIRVAIRHYYNVRYASATTNLAFEGDVIDAEQSIRTEIEKLVKPQKRDGPDWLALTPTCLENPPPWFFGSIWIATKEGEVFYGQYETTQGDPHFKTVDDEVIPCSDVTHTAAVSSPIHPGTAISS